MKRWLDRAHLYLLLQILLVCLCLIYLTARVLSPRLAPPVSLDLSLSSSSCPSLTASQVITGLFTGSRTAQTVLPVTDQAGTVNLPVQPSVQTVYINPCPQGSFSLHQVSLSSAKGSVAYALETGDLQCYGCQLIKQPDTSLNIQPTAPEPQLVISRIDNKARYLLPMIFRPEHYLPYLIFGLFLLLIALPSLSSLTSVAVLLQGGLIFYYALTNWSRLTALFPPPLINSQGIVAYAHLTGLSLTGDTVIFNLVLLFLPILVLAHYLCRQKRLSVSNTILITSALAGCLIYVLEQLI